MNQLTNGKSSIPVSIEHIDWESYAHLQKIRRRTRDSFKIEALELALEKAIEPNKRLASGVKLAEDLFRDGRKKELQKYNPESRTSKNLTEYAYFHIDWTEPSPSLEHNFKLSSQIVQRAISLLPSRYAIAVYIKFAELDNSASVKVLLNVGLKQYRNLLNQARRYLSNINGFDEAFFLLILHAQEADLISFFKKNIKGHLLAANAA